MLLKHYDCTNTKSGNLVLELQIVDWQVSYHVLQLLFDTCVKKMHADASAIDIIQLNETSYQACIHVSFEPNQFIGEAAPNCTAAKAKLLYKVLRHIDVVLGFDIIDVNHSSRQHINNQIERFDGKMEAIWQCGRQLEDLAKSCQADFNNKRSFVITTDSPNASEKWVLHTLNTCANRLEKAMSKLQFGMINFIPLKVQIIERYMAQ